LREEAMGSMTVVHDRGKIFRAQVRGHTILADQPVENKGEDTAPTPSELLVASLATCMGIYVAGFLGRHGIDTSGLSLEVTWEKATKPDRIKAFRVEIRLPAGIPEKLRAPLLRVASSCFVHNTITHQPEVEVELLETPREATL
jgi:uncharacterized OsmC-like protein